MWLELRHLFDTLSSDPSVRAIVLSGAGPKAFTTGLDVKAASQGGVLSSDGDADTARKAAHLRRYIASFQDCITALERCEKPVIAAMHGFALGLAVDIATACDVRLCTRDVRFAVKEVDIGLAADIGTLSRLPKVVGNYGWVKEVALSARVFGAEEAEKVGFVSRVFGGKEELVRGAVEVAGLIASKSPVAVQGTKDILNWSRDHPVNEGMFFLSLFLSFFYIPLLFSSRDQYGLDYANSRIGLRYTAVWNSAALQTNDVSAALLSGIQKRKPTFEKL